MIKHIEDILYGQAREKYFDEWVSTLKKHGIVEREEKGMIYFNERAVDDVQECMGTPMPDACFIAKHIGLTEDLIGLEEKIEEEFERLKAEWLRTKKMGT